jgi:RNA polymerase sigma factor (sigma-70 family)
MTDDLQLLRTYAENGSEDAFAAIVQRHLGLVYSAALRQVRDPHLAEEIAQAVFVILARKAGSLRDGTILSGWLFRTTRFAAARAMRGEQRRQHREHEAALMESSASEPAWEEVAPVLDDAIADLAETDRHAILLRFFERKELAEVGAALGSSEEAAKKRVSRAVDKLRAFFTRRGIVLSTTALATALTLNAAQAAPPGLSISVAAAVAANGGTAVATLTLIQATMKAMFQAQLKIAALLTALVLGAAAAGTVLAQQAANPKTTTPASTALFDRTTPLGALRSLARAILEADSRAAMDGIHASTPATTNFVVAFGSAVAAEASFRKQVNARFGKKPVRLVNVNIGQQLLDDPDAIDGTVEYRGTNHAIVRLTAAEGEPLDMVRSGGVWRMGEDELPGADNGVTNTTRFFSDFARKIGEAEKELAEGRYKSFEELTRALQRKVLSVKKP